PDERLEVAGDIKFTGGDLKTEAMGKMTPLFVRGSGRNNPAATGRQIKLGNDILPINNGRGLNLTVINASTHTLVSNTTYDTYIGTVGVNGLVNALRNATRDNIYILTSRDAWEPSVNNNLRFQARRLGLFKLAGMKINNYGISQGRFPYVAIFRGAGTGTNNSQVNRHVLEVIGTEATGGPQGLDVGVWLMDGGFSGGGVPTALVSPDPDRREAVVFVTSDNRVGINTFAPTQTLSVSGSAGKTGGGNWATFSDARVKKNIMPYKDGLAEVLQIAPKTFQYNGKGGYEEDGKTYYGVIAQEIEQIAPYTVSQVTTRDFEDQRLYDGTALTYMLINAVQEQQQIIERLEEKITAIEQQNASLLSQHSNKKQ
ncbi:MAG: tail fiber domain-containing protein, partial [Aureispira sp.]